VTTPATAIATPQVVEFVRLGYWYHSIEFGNGLVSNGVYDHRAAVAHYGIPNDLRGKRALDAGTADGFFAFELERRGAAVVAIDTDCNDGSVGHPDISPSRLEEYRRKYADIARMNEAGREAAADLGLPCVERRRIAAALLQSRVEFRHQSVYDLRESDGPFDVVFCGDLVEHLKDPLTALERLRAVTAGVCVLVLSTALPAGSRAPFLRRLLRRSIRSFGLGGYLVEASTAARYVGNASGGSFFQFHPYALEQAILAAGFADVRLQAEFDLTHIPTGMPNRHVVFHCYSRKGADGRAGFQP